MNADRADGFRGYDVYLPIHSVVIPNPVSEGAFASAPE
jgi:hypothetical protein